MQTASDKDYQIFELQLGASLDDVKEAYRDLVQVWHPDKYVGKPRLLQRAHRNMVEINLAYERISKALAGKPRPRPSPSPNKASSSAPRQESKHQAVDPWTNSLGMKFVPVPGTSVHFAIWETRVQDYAAYDKAGWWVNRSWKKPGFTQTDTHPVTNVSWEDARKFCAWLTKEERRAGLLTAKQEYRLPTDAEWSWAVGIGNRERAGTPQSKSGKLRGVFPWGTQWPPPKGAGNYPPSVGTDLFDHTSPVGSFAGNSLGLFDLGGNIWEWCEDVYGPGFREIYRVSRGGAWWLRKAKAKGSFLSTARADRLLTSRDNLCGFRCVLVR